METICAALITYFCNGMWKYKRGKYIKPWHCQAKVQFPNNTYSEFQLMFKYFACRINHKCYLHAMCVIKKTLLDGKYLIFIKFYFPNIYNIYYVQAFLLYSLNFHCAVCLNIRLSVNKFRCRLRSALLLSYPRRWWFWVGHHL